MPEDHPDAGAAPITAATPGAGEVQTDYKHLGSEGQARGTLITPAAGKRVRMIALHVAWFGAAGYPQFCVWFGTGNTILHGNKKGIFLVMLEAAVQYTDGIVWPAGEGPLGEVDEVVSYRSPVEGGANTVYLVQWREE